MAVVTENPKASSAALSNEEILRYSRHLIMPEVGMEGQQKLKAARVLCIGAGGLGSPLLMYLAAAGVGTLGVVDFDVVDFTNLQRQIIHSTADVGRRKLESAPIVRSDPPHTFRAAETKPPTFRPPNLYFTCPRYSTSPRSVYLNPNSRPLSASLQIAAQAAQQSQICITRL